MAGTRARSRTRVATAAVVLAGVLAASVLLTGWLLAAPAYPAPTPDPDATPSSAGTGSSSEPTTDPNPGTGAPPAGDPPVAEPTPAAPPVAGSGPIPQPEPTVQPPPVAVQPPVVQPPVPQPPVVRPTTGPPVSGGSPLVPPPLTTVRSSAPGILLPITPSSSPATGTGAPSAAVAGGSPGPTSSPFHTGGPQNGVLPGHQPDTGTPPAGDGESTQVLRTTRIPQQGPFTVVIGLIVALVLLGLPLRRAVEHGVGGLAGLLPRRGRRLYGERWVNQHLTLALGPAEPSGAELADHEPGPIMRLQFSADRGPVLGRPAEVR